MVSEAGLYQEVQTDTHPAKPAPRHRNPGSPGHRAGKMAQRNCTEIQGASEGPPDHVRLPGLGARRVSTEAFERIPAPATVNATSWEAFSKNQPT